MDKTCDASSSPSRFLRWLNSPALFVCLLLVASALAAKSVQVWAQRRATLQAPVLSGYDWAKHPDVVLITYPIKDCGCGAPPIARVKGALKQGKDVVVLASAPSAPLSALKNANFPARHFYFAPHTKIDIIQHFSHGRVTEVNIRNGYVSF